MGFRVTSLLRLGIVLALLFAGAGSVAAQHILVLSTDSLTSTTRTISGLQTVIREKHPDAVTTILRTAVDSVSVRKLTDSMKLMHHEVIVPIGTAATLIADQACQEHAVVFASVLYPELSGFLRESSPSTRLVTGASLNIPFEIQFKHFKKIVPSLKRIGVLYSNVTRSLIGPARQSARDLGLELIAIEVESERGLLTAMDSLVKVTNGIWTLADPKIFTPQGTRFVLMHATKFNLPVMGFSRNVVESGALFALDFDYKAIGRQAGALVVALLSGQDTRELKVTVPDIIWFHYNQKTSDHLNISIPSEFVAIAKEVYR